MFDASAHNRAQMFRFFAVSSMAFIAAGCASGTTTREAQGTLVDPAMRPAVDQVWLGTVPAPGMVPSAPAQPTAQPTAEMQAVLDQLGSFGAPPIAESTPANARKAPTPTDAVMALLASRNQPVPLPMVGISHVTIPGPHGDMLARVYTPRDSAGSLPVIVYFHGGGWVIAGIDTYDPSARALAEASGAVVVSVGYHQAPTHQFPAAADDAFTAYQWALQNAAQIGGDSARIAVAGESAGGNLATVVSMMARDRGIQMPVHQLLVYPITSFNLDSPSYIANANAAPLNKAAMHWFFDKYMQSPADSANPYLIPLASSDLSRLPATTIINAQIDPLLWDGEEYARRLRAAGVPVEQRTFPGVTHEFFGMGAVLPEAREAVQMAGMRLRTAFAPR